MTWRDAGRHEVGAAVCGLWVTGCGQGGDAENTPEALRPPVLWNGRLDLWPSYLFLYLIFDGHLPSYLYLFLWTLL